MGVDLHIHSTWSDGTNSPDEIIQLARERGLSAVAITDHDTVDGVGDGCAAGSRLGIEVIPGIELSVVHEDLHMHMLGYFIDIDDAELNKTLDVIQNSRAVRNERIIEKLNEIGVAISIEEVRRKSGCGQTGRPHIGQVLVDRGVVKNLDEAFERYLKKGRRAYVHRYVLSARDAILLIRGAGGVAVLAHPGSIDNSLKKIPPLLDKLIPLGLDGLELYYPVHTKKIFKKLKAMASFYDLAVTGGSDYHGDIRPNTEIAGGKRLHVPDEVVTGLKLRLARRNIPGGTGIQDRG